MRQSMKMATLATTLVGSLLMVACGGGSDSSSSTAPATATPTTVAATATPVAATATPVSTATATPVSATATPVSATATPVPATATPVPGVTVTPTTAPTSAATTWLPGSELASSLVGGAITAGTNTNFAATAAEITVGGMSFWSKTAGALRVYNDNTNNSVNYNGNSLDGTTFVVGNTVDVTATSRYVAVPASAAALSATVNFTHAASSTAPLCADAPSQIAIADSTGKILAIKSVCDYATTQGSITATVASASKLYVLFSRNGAGGGGIRLWSISYTK